MLNTIVRTQSAMTSLPFVKPESEVLIREWLHQMLFPMNPTLEDPKVSLSTTIDASKVTCWADNDLEILKKQLLEFMKVSNFNETESKVLNIITDAVPEGRLCSWLQLSEGGQETGWVMDGVFSLETAFKLVPKGTLKDKLQAWYKSHDADACIRVGRSIAGNRFTILHTELFGDSSIEDIQLYIDLMTILDLSPLPEALLEMIVNNNPEYLEIAFWIAKEGLIKTGLVVPTPSDVFVRQMSLVYGEENADTLAAFEGSIGADAPIAMQLSRDALGIQIELIY